MNHNNHFGKFFLRIVIPSIMVIVLFVMSFFVLFLPAFETNMMNAKKDMIRELTNSAHSIVNDYHQKVQNNEIKKKQAKQLAAARIQHIRYGDEGKDYFWITDTTPKMIMHPYRPELNNQNLSNYKDPQGKRLFVEAVDIVNKKGHGYIHYMWQWKDDSTRIVPKLSYVKEFEPWGWVIGTGIYLEDVKQEINALQSNLIKTTLGIFIFISIFIFYSARQSLLIERRRRKAEENLKQSRLKYKTLVEASTEGTLMVLNDNIIYANSKIYELTGFSEQEIKNRGISGLFSISESDEPVDEAIHNIKGSKNFQAVIQRKTGQPMEVVLTISNIKIDKENGYIVVIKEVSRQQKREQYQVTLAEELQNSLLLMNIPIRQFIKKHFSKEMNASIQEAGAFMKKKKQDALIITKDNTTPIGIITDQDFKNRVISENIDTSKPVSTIMSSPLILLNDTSLLHDALLMMEQHHICHLPVKNHQGNVTGIVHKHDLLAIQHNTTSYLQKEIDKAEVIEEIQAVYDRLPGIIQLLLSSGATSKNIASITTSVSDAITKRLIELSIEKIGQPPVSFAFIALGSEGRQEQTLKTDQDNAMIFEDTDNKDTKEIQQYFLKLAGNINDWLDQIGYEYCKGGFMANNKKWCQPLSEWKHYFEQWVDNSDPESILEISIMFDFRIVYGSEILVNALQEHINRTTESKAVFFHHMMQSVQRFKPPVNLLGNIVPDSRHNQTDVFDIKKAIVPITGFARIYAIQHKIPETNTIARLQTLKEQRIIKNELINEILQVYDFLMLIRFKSQSQKILQNNTVDNYIDIQSLTNIELSSLKKSFSDINDLFTQLNFDFKGTA